MDSQELEKKALDIGSWVDQAKCKGLDTKRWYPPRDKDIYKVDAEYAKGVCKGKDGKPPCPVRHKCLLYSFLNEEEHGIWGGLSHRERAALERKAAKKGVELAVWIETQIK